LIPKEKTVMRRAVLTFSSILAAAWLPACSAPTSSSPTLEVTLSSNPDPASASGPTGVQYKVTNADDSVTLYEYDYRTSFTVTVQETGGMALDVTALNLTVQQATGGIVITPSGGDQVYFKFNSSAATNHINANGSATVGFDVWYDLPSGGREALITVGFTFQDDDDNTYSDTLQVKVAP
jgi:hypothetical protein